MLFSYDGSGQTNENFAKTTLVVMSAAPIIALFVKQQQHGMIMRHRGDSMKHPLYDLHVDG